MKHTIHIISFDIPFPANYGGVIDVFYKLKTLHELGLKVILHCFEYGRSHSDELNKYAFKVYYYKRNRSVINFFSGLPYIVSSRSSKVLLQNLTSDNYPILFEGHHCCKLIDNVQLRDRLKMVRTHNVEHLYYYNLFKVERFFIKRMYFKWESKQLETFESRMQSANTLLCISESDNDYYKRKFKHTEVVSAFHSNNELDILEGKGKYVLYHGNLGVGENNQAALFLVTNVFNYLDIPCYIAGNNPSRDLMKAVSELDHVKLFSNISSEKIDNLIQNAHINVLPTFQATGIKLKLLNALHKGRFCIVNKAMVESTGLESYCVVRNTAEEIQKEILSLINQDFSTERISQRKALLKGVFSNRYNAKKIVELLDAAI